MAPRRVAAGDAITRPAMAPSAPVRTTVRITVDLPTARHRALRDWALDTALDASVLVLGLLELVETDPAVRVRAEEAARAVLRARREATGR